MCLRVIEVLIVINLNQFRLMNMCCYELMWMCADIVLSKCELMWIDPDWERIGPDCEWIDPCWQRIGPGCEWIDAEREQIGPDWYQGMLERTTDHYSTQSNWKLWCHSLRKTSKSECLDVCNRYWTCPVKGLSTPCRRLDCWIQWVLDPSCLLELCIWKGFGIRRRIGMGFVKWSLMWLAGLY